MKIRFIFVCTHLALFGLGIRAQNTKEHFSRWQLTPSIGYAYSPTTIYNGAITDHLIRYDFSTPYYQIFSGAYFPFHHFGAEILLQTAYSNDGINHNAAFTSNLENLYANDYYISSSTGSEPGGVALGEGNAYRYIFGLIYRVETDRIQFLIKARLAQQALFINSAQVKLKEKGTNTVLNLDFEVNHNSSAISIGPAITIGYRLSKYLLLHLDLAYYYTKYDFNYSETLANPLSGESTTTYHPYQYNLNLFSSGIGLIIELGTAKPLSFMKNKI